MSAVFTLTGYRPAKDKPRRTYRIRVDNAIDLNLSPDTQGHLVVTGASRCLETTISPQLLLRLLQLNSYFPSTNNIVIGYLEEKRCLQLWVRQPMNRMKDKDVIQMMARMASGISHVNSILYEQDCST